MAASQLTQDICITFIQRRPNVFDVGPTLYKCYTNVSCSLAVFTGSVAQAVAHLLCVEWLLTKQGIASSLRQAKFITAYSKLFEE